MKLCHIEQLTLNQHATLVLEGDNTLFCIDTLTFNPHAKLIIRSPFPILIGTLNRKGKREIEPHCRLTDINFVGRNGQKLQQTKLADNPHKHGTDAPAYGTLLIHRVKGIFHVAARGGDGINGRPGHNQGCGEDGGHGGDGGHVSIYYGKARTSDGSILQDEQRCRSRGGQGGVASSMSNAHGQLNHAGRMGLSGKPGQVTIRLCKTPI
ncbi:hypothetical protein [Magnetococcus sp. PR-3]|uniref:hypothetical protein n=1 Tax=Magnetococcus sp. PR-3 TaxID=3120355 RepID=UPI002FCDFB6F